MKFLLDTNAVIAVMKGQVELARRLRCHAPSDFGISSIVAHELFYGAEKSEQVAKNIVRIEMLAFEVVDFDEIDARASGKIRAVLARAGTPIGPYDVLIAGQALARSVTLVTRNVSELRRVPELSVEDWEVPG